MFRALRPSASLYRSAVLAKNAAVAPRVSVAMNFARMYSAGAGLARSDVEKRVLDILAGFNKVDANKISLKANFNADLGLDSLDTVEVVMAIEEEFSIEIPDKDADEIKSAEQAVEYISKRDDAH
ncbi:hypothetical protein BGZ93_004198 [Podila epicladia]|nr:hypothetical protein BGZ74_003072 [Mortierella antarctica]KAG0034418.1 hypothetical protein BGZ82_005754 [Podila clonocystis]KAG0085952.1 hypothetical protein BGZ92_008574 [Podila epicladia]KAG0096651.1 hypothetical protein BGZ93_004198 [Podila epicladia]KAG0351148.1 hypothetical protein BG005_009382 [Podila minutissima]